VGFLERLDNWSSILLLPLSPHNNDDDFRRGLGDGSKQNPDSAQLIEQILRQQMNSLVSDFLLSLLDALSPSEGI